MDYELRHHGIKGQKWGIRRFQRKDGSLTVAGKKRYYDTPELNKQKAELDGSKSAAKSAKKAYGKAYDTYSLFPTKKNEKALDQALADYKDAKAAYKHAKLKYKTNKEVARIEDRGIEFKHKSKHRLKLEDQYKKMGMNDEQAQAAANNRIRTEKILAASAAVTVTACAAYIAVQARRDKIDKVIKAGESLQRVEMQDTGGKLHDMFYAAQGDHDKTRYKNLLGMARKNQTGHAYIMELQAASDVKVASKHNAAKIFGDLYKNDSDFRKSVESAVDSHFNGSNRIKNLGDMSDRNIKKMYENFNANIMFVRNSKSGADTKFYDKLKAAGYGAIQDINDMKYSGYNARNPLIIFDNSKNNIFVKKVSELTGDVNKAGNAELLKATGEAMARDFVERAGPLSAVALTGSAVATYKSNPSKNYTRQRGISKWS